jgi:hypothetical protein
MDAESLVKEVHDLKLDIQLMKKDMTQFEKVMDKLDSTNDKIQDLIDNINTIVHLHDKRLTMTERDTTDLQERVDVVEEKMKQLEKFEWAFVGIVGFLTFLLNFNNITSFFSK